MEETCPYCRHVVSLPPQEGDRAVRCDNCGATLPRPEARFAGAVPAATPLPPQPLSAAFAMQPPPDGLGVASLILGMVFFVPVVTQVLAIALGAAALLRRPTAQSGRGRSTAAWAGLILGVFFLLIWVYLGLRLITLSRTVVTMPMTSYMATPYTGAADGEVDLQVESQAMYTALDQVSAAIRRYRNDYRHWPHRTEDLASMYLPASVGVLLIPQGPKSAPRLWMVPGVDPDADSPDRIVAYSVRVRYGREAGPLSVPHRWVLRLDGRIELVPADEVDRAVPGAWGSP